MFELDNITRKNIKALVPYSSARSEFTQVADIYIDANENPYNTGYNRYPDPFQKQLKDKISEIKGVAANRIFIGNGSDEIIDLLMRCICQPSVDNIITFSPSYTMYRTSAQINDLEIRSLDLNADFTLPVSKIKSLTNDRSKILFICSPNNPVGCVVSHATIEACCQFFGGIVVVDEAYIDFSTMPSAIALLDKYPNLLILQTLSKAYGMANIRVGISYASVQLVALLNKVKPPYNISGLSQHKALELLQDRNKYTEEVELFKREREKLIDVFSQMSIFTKVLPSEANFVLVTSPYFKEIYNYLASNGVIARLRDIPPLIANGLRYSVGTPDENVRVIELMKKFDLQKNNIIQ